ncbi:hypothetical protein BN946_scf184771.g5 [Trametes cinnabarina]|uniref:RING-type domain-containing protein n=1 Tax=Pycnoporus cinnabarinus TaxID=5643 RepID=A0A060SQR3_PYCCI|nr:hypothetical protein BN946_scf184771.g5 [Trametes cinnabarina]
MGQSASRNTGSQAVSPSTTLPPRPQFSNTSLSSTGQSQRDGTEPLNHVPSPSAKKSRHTSVRRGVRSFLRTRTQSDATTPSPASSSSSPHLVPSIRKRWRSTRRFSKAPASLPDLSEALQEGERSPTATATAVGAQVAPASDESSALSARPSLPTATCPTEPVTSPVEVPNETDGEPSCNDDASLVQDANDEDDLPHNEVDAAKADAPTQRDDRAQDIEREIHEFLLERPRQDSLFVEGSSQDGRASVTPEPVSVGPSALPNRDTESTSEPVQTTPRHFPPPGTLVVVQGVVNTSDTPTSAQTSPSTRPAGASSAANMSSTSTQSIRRSASLPRSDGQADERHSARHRLSAFIPRPSSTRRRRSFTSEPAFASVQASRSSSDVSSSVSDMSSSPESLRDASDLSTTQDHQAQEETDANSRPLSPGSIDVLGTLLSVAAAATAASLFSPSLGFQVNTDPNVHPPTPSIPRPMSPTPTAGLGGGPAFSVVPDGAPELSTSPPPVPGPTPQQREGRERIRNVWESFRERLGLNRSGTPSTGDNAGSTAEESANMRPSEIMLAEMARALNVGLGLTPEGSSSATTDVNMEGQSQTDGGRAADPARSDRPPPPEDSFERFLINLQADLRTVLSENGVGASAARAQNVSDSGDVEATPSAGDVQRRDSPVPGHAPSSPLSSESDDGDDDEVPPLEDVSDSEDEDYDEMNIEDGASIRTATPMPSGHDLPNRSNQSSPSEGGHIRDAEGGGDNERRPPGIQLWRLYRFQPIHASQISGHAAATTPPGGSAFPHSPASTTPFSPSAQAERPRSDSDPPSGSSLPSIFPPASSSPTPPTDGAESPSSTVPSATDPNANMVVPVIVVGLQSVEMGQVHGHAHQQHQHEPEPAPSLDSRNASSSTGSLAEGRRSSSTISGHRSGDTTPRGRSWPSRAATALRNLRHGRRNGSSVRQSTEGTGSRTFLIYVIGGYYPPNHHMVTGPDNLDSYEALWELAELLGQVKPQVASWEDIEKSDLQIVKFSELEQYERDGKVASNCTERCLICLDDYQTDDDVRLMRCRHAFHKDCVDKWLQGVSTADELVH